MRAMKSNTDNGGVKSSAVEAVKAESFPSWSWDGWVECGFMCLVRRFQVRLFDASLLLMHTRGKVRRSFQQAPHTEGSREEVVGRLFLGRRVLRSG